MSDRCEKTDLLTDQCSHCRGLDEEPRPELTVLDSHKARFDGRCGVCDRYTIREGGPLHRVVEAGGVIQEAVWAGDCCVGDRR